MRLKSVFLTVLCVLSLTAFVILSSASQAVAEDCSPMLSDLISYASLDTDMIFHPNTYKFVNVKMTTNRPDSRYVSYAEGQLKRKKIRGLFGDFVSKNGGSFLFILKGELSQTFSDRVAFINDDPNCNSGFCSIIRQPFNVRLTDSLGMSISKDAKVTLSLDSWGGGKVEFNGTCSNNILYGSTPADGTFFTFSFVKGEGAGEPA